MQQNIKKSKLLSSET